MLNLPTPPAQMNIFKSIAYLKLFFRVWFKTKTKRNFNLFLMLSNFSALQILVNPYQGKIAPSCVVKLKAWPRTLPRCFTWAISDAQAQKTKNFNLYSFHFGRRQRRTTRLRSLSCIQRKIIRTIVAVKMIKKKQKKNRK